MRLIALRKWSSKEYWADNKVLANGKGTWLIEGYWKSCGRDHAVR